MWVMPMHPMMMDIDYMEYDYASMREYVEAYRAFRDLMGLKGDDHDALLGHWTLYLLYNYGSNIPEVNFNGIPYNPFDNEDFE